MVRKVIDKAKAGNMVALRFCLDRIVPPCRDRLIFFALPTLNSASDAGKALAAISNAIARGELTPTEARDLAEVITAYVKAIEATEIERRLQLLEAASAR